MLASLVLDTLLFTFSQAGEMYSEEGTVLTRFNINSSRLILVKLVFSNIL
jgi:hypothetical protein